MAATSPAPPAVLSETPAGPLTEPGAGPASAATPAAARTRNRAIDVLRGLVMVVMTLDHARDFYAGFVGNATNPRTTTPILFFTRWVTHFCAPVFVFLAGTAAFLQGARKTPAERARFLVTRGLWLVFLELTVMRLGWSPDPFYRFTLLQVIWVLGWCMVLLAPVSYLPARYVGALGVAIIALHNTLDPIHASAFGRLDWLWKILHDPGVLQPLPGRRAYAAYSVLPWFGVICAGFGFGVWMQEAPEVRRARTLRLGLALIVAFVVVRAVNIYGDPRPWASQPRGALYTLLSFLNTNKYPPSLAFVLMTLGPALCALALFERVSDSRWARPLWIIGAVPLFYYVLHLLLLRYSALPFAYARFGGGAFAPPPQGAGGSPRYPLWVAYLAWVCVVLVLYPACRWFAGVKQRRRDWWLSYM